MFYHLDPLIWDLMGRLWWKKRGSTGKGLSAFHIAQTVTCSIVTPQPAKACTCRVGLVDYHGADSLALGIPHMLVAGLV